MLRRSGGLPRSAGSSCGDDLTKERAVGPSHMNSVSPTQAAEGAAAKPPTRRALAKQQTRVKVLAAARRLFSEQGYEGATIRDIATAAGMSTGAVFANFTDKSDLFREIMMADLASLAEAMAAAGRRGVDIGDVLLKIFMAGYEFYLTQLPLARAAFSVAWSLEDGPALRNSPPLIHLRGLMVAALRDAVAKGELPGELSAGDFRRLVARRAQGPLTRPDRDCAGGHSQALDARFPLRRGWAGASVTLSWRPRGGAAQSPVPEFRLRPQRC